MIPKQLNTPYQIVKSDTTESVEESIVYRSEGTVELTETETEAVNLITSIMIKLNTNNKITTTDAYTRVTVKLFDKNKADEKLTLLYEKSIHAMVLTRIVGLATDIKTLSLFILPLLEDSAIEKSSQGSSIVRDIKDDDKDLDREAVYLSESLSNFSPAVFTDNAEFYGSQDRRVKKKSYLLSDSIDATHTINDKDRKRLKEAKKIARVLEMYIMGIGGRTSTSKPSKRFDRKKAYSDDAIDIYSDKKGIDDYGEFNRVANLVIDCSGSMYGIFDHAMLLAESISLIPNIKGKIILTSSHGSIDFNMPVDHGIISSFMCSDGAAEGIKDTLIKYEKDIQTADVTLVFTDANIEDGHPTAEFKKKYENKLIGTLIAKNIDSFNAKKSLSRHFNRYLIASSTKELIDVIMKKGKL